MPNQAGMAIQAKSLTILEDQLQHEYLAYKKAGFYAQSFQNTLLKNLASDLAQQHRQRYNRLFDYLNSHA